MSEAIKLEISNDSIKQVINANVHMAVTQALLPHKEEFIKQLVETALLTKSKSDDYRYKNDKEIPTVLEDMVRRIIAEEAKAAIIEWAQSHRKEIGEQIRKAMSSGRFGKAMAMQIAEKMATAQDYRFSMTVSPVMDG